MSVRYSSVERAARLARARASQAAPGALGPSFSSFQNLGNEDLCGRRAGFLHRRRAYRGLFPGKKYTRKKFSFQISDQLPGWLQMRTNIDGFRFEQIVQDGRK